jgi:hypothetical protein
MPDPSSTSPLPNASSAGTPAVFRERLWPNIWIWIISAGISGAGILVFAPISMAAGYIAAGVLFTIIALMLLTSTPTILVTPDTLTVGRATIERRYIGDVEAFRGKDATAQRGTKLNGLAYLCIRGWIDPVVRIDITDPTDRTPYWLTSTRRPEELTAALARK